MRARNGSHALDESEAVLLVEGNDVEPGIAVVRVGKTGATVLPTQETRGERAPDGEAQTITAHHRDDIPLDIATQQRVMHLSMGEGCQALGFLDLDGGGRPPRRPVGKAEVAHLPGAYNGIERFERLFERRERILAMSDVHVDPVGAESPQALVD